MIWFTDTRGAVEVAFTDRHGGAGPETGLDLAEPVPGGDVGGLEQRLDVVARSLAADGSAPTVVRMRQVHGSDVHTVDRAWSATTEPPEVDGLVTASPGVALLTRAADCVPVLLADPVAGVVGAAHAGRKGLVAGVVPATVARMRALGAQRLVAWVGPHVCGGCYEVPDELRSEVAAAVPAAVPPGGGSTTWGTPAVDLGAGVRAQLEADGAEVVDLGRCTREDPDLYSYRRDGRAAGRFGGLVWVRP